MITWPHGGRPKPHTSYADEVMSGFEYAAAATMIEAGMIKEGLAIVKAVSDRYRGNLKVGYGGGWGNFGYSGNPFGDDECGKFYSRAMSIWSILLGLQGFSYDGPQKSIGFDPVWKPENHVSFFTTAKAWGNYMQTRNENEQKSEIKVKYGQLEIEEISIGISNSNIREVLLSMNGKTVNTDWTKSGNVIRLTINNLKLEADDSIEILIKL
jgi:hypothetical protein